MTFLEGLGQSAQDLVLDGPLLLAGLIAVAAGLLSFFSPCCLPLVPGYLSYVAGLAGEDVAAQTQRVASSGETLVAQRRHTRGRTVSGRFCS